MTPLGSLGMLTLPTRAPIARTTSSSPKTLASPREPTSLVPSTIRGARSTASMSALSAAVVVCSVNWTS